MKFCYCLIKVRIDYLLLGRDAREGEASTGLRDREEEVREMVVEARVDLIGARDRLLDVFVCQPA